MINIELFKQMEISHSLKHRLQFEFASFIGRNFLKKRGFITPQIQSLLLDIGAGSNYTEGWTHLDFYTIPITLRLSNWFQYLFNKSVIKPQIEHDIRYPLKCESNSVDGIYCSHTIEHLLPLHAINLLSEMFRILKPGKFARIIVPDFQIAMKKYIDSKTTAPENGCEYIMEYTQNFAHLSTWDEHFLISILNDCGFIECQVVKYGKSGRDKALIKEQPVREYESLVVEGKKPDND